MYDDTQHIRLHEIADAASDGPWEWDGDELVGPHDPDDLEDFPDEDRREYLLARNYPAGLASPANADAEFIATFNPAKVKELLNQIDAMTREIYRRA